MTERTDLVATVAAHVHRGRFHGEDEAIAAHPIPWECREIAVPIGDTGDADLPWVILDANGRNVLTIYEDYGPSLQPKHQHLAVAIVAAVNARQQKPTWLGCHDCGLPYSDPAFVDFVVEDDLWRRISPTGDEGGLLCVNCIVRRTRLLGIDRVRGAFRSGPFVAEAANG